MSFFKGSEAIAVVKVPDELYDSIMSLSSDIGKLTQDDPRSGQLIVNEENGSQKKYNVNLSDADKKSILFNETDDGFKVHFLAQFNGTAIPDDEDDLVKNLTDYIEDTRREFDHQDIQRADKFWEASQRRNYDSIGKKRQQKADVYTEGGLKEKLFEYFERNDVIPYDDLKERTNASKQMLDKCLKEIADFQREDKSYKLKEQYRRSGQPNKKVKTN